MQYCASGVIVDVSDSLPLFDLCTSLKLAVKVSAQVGDMHEIPQS